MRTFDRLIALTFIVLTAAGSVESFASQAIGIYEKNPRYWQYKGRPVVLLGGSVDDNLFQIPNLRAHLDLLKSVGGNYVRNTMSSRDDGNLWPFKKLADGRYDMDEFDKAYWRRFENFLEDTYERDIIVQIEIWATFDYYRENWDVNPFNPKNNINYTAEETGLPAAVKTHPTQTENNFFWSVPAERNQKTVLKYQERFVNKILSYTLDCGNVLYCMDNETSVTPEWGWYWSKFIKKRAADEGVPAHTTEMWDKWDLAHRQHNGTFDHPEIFSFVDISQNNHQKGQAHWDNAQKQRERIAKKLRPLNNVKIYGADTGRFGNTQDGLARFWRNIFGGLASARFHRPDSGQGLNKNAQAHLKSMSMLIAKLDIFNTTPDSAGRLLSDRSDNEAYLTRIKGRQYAVYFPKGGSVNLDLSSEKGDFTLQWLDVAKSRWQAAARVKAPTRVTLTTPGKGHWVGLVTKTQR